MGRVPRDGTLPDATEVEDGEVAGARACRFSGEVDAAGAGSFSREVEVAIPPAPFLSGGVQEHGFCD